MGLDQYAYATKKAIAKSVDFEIPEEKEEVAYWRKHPNLQGWMERLYEQKGGEDVDFNVVPVTLDLDDLEQLEKAVIAGTLPETDGFFFGSNSDQHYKEQDLQFIAKARNLISEGYTVFYYCWY